MKTWFQSGPTNAAPEVASDLKIDGGGKAAAPPRPPSQPRKASDDPKPKPPAAPQSTDYDDEDNDGLPTMPPAAVAAMAAKRQSSKLDNDAMDVIREEVTREQSARKTEADPIETQIDLGIDDTETKDRANAARDRMRAKTGNRDDIEDVTEVDVDLEAALADDTVTEPATKRELLPDIEEINSTLTEAPDQDEDPDDYMEMSPTRHPKSRNRSGFRLGFGLMLLFAAILVGLYVYSPALSKSVPAMAGFFDGYVSTVDNIRAWLDRSAQDLVDQITKLLGTVN